MNSPFKATVFFLTDAIAESGITVFPPFVTGVTLTSSQLMGTYLCSIQKFVFVDVNSNLCCSIDVLD